MLHQYTFHYHFRRERVRNGKSLVERHVHGRSWYLCCINGCLSIHGHDGGCDFRYYTGFILLSSHSSVDSCLQTSINLIKLEVKWLLSKINLTSGTTHFLIFISTLVYCKVSLTLTLTAIHGR